MVSQYSSDRGGIRGEKVLKIVKFEETPFGVYKYNRYFITEKGQVDDHGYDRLSYFDEYSNGFKLMFKYKD